ncbi:hypothetical protein [Nocardia sp. BMG111209]|uniref:hypothetical protein n=1 Tax=Nocardia sp. BMG111209 TaxID=1160137 RepID=UPI0003794CFB|nr:hypothetical protein [Nocardia sp. BMG111209]
MSRSRLIATVLPALAVLALSLAPAPSSAAPAAGDDCDPAKDGYQPYKSGHGLACEPSSDGHNRWQDAGAESKRIVQPGEACPGPNSDVALGPQGQKMVCVGDPADATWKAM